MFVDKSLVSWPTAAICFKHLDGKGNDASKVSHNLHYDVGNDAYQSVVYTCGIFWVFATLDPKYTTSVRAC